MAEQVIYTRDTRYHPVFQYYSLPTSCVGGGETMPEARASYHAALADMLDLDESLLPLIVEHVEVPVTDDVWVRTVLDTRRGRERGAAFELVQRVIPRLDDVTRAELEGVVTVGGSAVMAVVLPDDPMSLVVDQMSLYDALWMTFPTAQGLSWAAIYRPGAEGLEASFEESLDADVVRMMTVSGFIRKHVQSVTPGVQIEVFPGGAIRSPAAPIGMPLEDRILGDLALPEFFSLPGGIEIGARPAAKSEQVAARKQLVIN